MIIMVLNLRDRGKWYLYYFAVSTFDFYTRGGERLGSFQTKYGAPDPLAINRDDLNVILAV